MFGFGRKAIIVAVLACIAAVTYAVLMETRAQQFPKALERNGQLVSSHALDQALQEWVANLFTVWMRDNAGQPQRAITGAQQAIASYHFMRNRIGLETAPRDHIKQLLFASLDHALHLYFVKMFNGWMHKNGGRPDPDYEKEMDEALKAYADARQAVDKNW
jgi:hypothetical protein